MKIQNEECKKIKLFLQILHWYNSCISLCFFKSPSINYMKNPEIEWKDMIEYKIYGGKSNSWEKMTGAWMSFFRVFLVFFWILLLIYRGYEKVRKSWWNIMTEAHIIEKTSKSTLSQLHLRHVNLIYVKYSKYNRKFLTTTHPCFKWQLQIFTTPNVETVIISTKALKKLSINCK